MYDLMLVLATLSFVMSVAFMAAGLLWLKKFRNATSRVLSESVGVQIEATKRLSAEIDMLKRQQQVYEQNLLKLAESHLQMRHDLGAVSTRLENSEKQIYGVSEQRVIH
ncbi:MAG: hypothetical protein PHX43_02345 [Alphaproteobacteria bacterium]|nr:hypothetical protein [Alphaproteobacteria bacterium]